MDRDFVTKPKKRVVCAVQSSVNLKMEFNLKLSRTMIRYVFKLLCIFTCVLCFSTMDAQQVKSRSDIDKKTLKKYKEAISEGRKKNYTKSLRLYEKVLKKYPEFIDAQLRQAGMLHNMKQYEASAVAFGKAIAMAPEYDPQMYYSLAIVNNDLKKYDLAARNFQFYVDRSTDRERSVRAADLRDRAAFAHESIHNPVPFDPKKMEGGINTMDSEYIPLVNLEGDRLIFTRRVDGQEDFYISEIADGKSVRVAAIDGLNTPQNEGVHTISSDGKLMIFTACDRRKTGIGSCDLYYARLDSKYWTIPSNMGKVVNSISWDAQPSLSADGKKLFFSSNRQGGYGGNDIWMSSRTDTSGWTYPVLLPEVINTTGNEESPFIHPDGHTLYFRSNKHIGMGGFDIFYSRYVDSTSTWSPAANIGYPINTEGDEGAMSVSLDGATAYFASDMEYVDDLANANLDIYTFELYPEARPMLTTFIKARVTDAVTGLPIEARYRIQVLTEQLEPVTGAADRNGEFINSLPTNRDYALFVEANGYFHYSEHFDLQGIQDLLDPYRLEIVMKPVPDIADRVEEESKPIILNNIFFESGSAVLSASSSFEIAALAEDLTQNRMLKVKILGHTDNVGDEYNNQKLSEDRAKSVAEALIARGVDRTRVSYIGFGESKPISENDSAAGRGKNRRTEFILVR